MIDIKYLIELYNLYLQTKQNAEEFGNMYGDENELERLKTELKKYGIEVEERSR